MSEVCEKFCIGINRNTSLFTCIVPCPRNSKNWNRVVLIYLWQFSCSTLLLNGPISKNVSVQASFLPDRIGNGGTTAPAEYVVVKNILYFFIASYLSVRIDLSTNPAILRAPPFLPLTPYILMALLNFSMLSLAPGYFYEELKISFLRPKGLVFDTIEEKRSALASYNIFFSIGMTLLSLIT